jgi:tripartite-type tricarboxylate transporter receptor subunit TctC
MRKLGMLGAAIMILGSVATSAAQDFPSRTVNLVVSSGPGTVPDVLSRGIAEQLSKRWGQSVVVENKPGAAYAIAALEVMRAPPDGHTLIASELAMFTYQHHLYRKTKRPFDGERDFEPVAGLAQVPVTFIAHPSVPARNIGELLELARKSPGTLNYGTAGPGTTPHMSMLMFENLAGLKLTAVHYRSIALALNDVTAGHVQLVVMSPSISLENYRAGKLKFLGVGSAQRMPQLPEVPAVSEFVKGYVANVSFGVAAPTNTPAPIVNRINADIQAVLKEPEFQKRFIDPQLLQPIFGSPAEFKKSLIEEGKRWEAVIRDTGISID